MNAEERNEIKLLRQEVATLDGKVGAVDTKLGDFREDISEKMDAVKIDFNAFKVEEAREGASHMHRDECLLSRENCQKNEDKQNIKIDAVQATINRGLGVLSAILFVPAFATTVWVVIQIIKAVR